MVNHEFSKYEIATYLRDYNWLMVYALLNQNASFFDIFKHHMYNDGKLQYSIKDYYYEMISVYEILLTSKFLTMSYDNYFDYLPEASIDEFVIPDSIFVNSEDKKKFSKKNIIRNIRNAFNHNDNPNHDLLKLVRVNENDKDVVKAEVFLKNTKPIPFHVILSIEQLMAISLNIDNANTCLIASLRSSKPVFLNSTNVNETLNNMFLRKFYSRRKLSEDQKQLIIEHVKSTKDTINNEKFILDNGMEYRDFMFDIAQKVKIEEELKYWESMGVNGNDVVNHLMRTVMPLSYLKDRTITMNFILANYYFRSANKSLSDLIKDASTVLLEGSVDTESPFIWYVESFSLDKNLLFDAMDFDNLAFITNSIYYGYLFDTLIMNKDIKISDTKIIEREKIRDAFVHMRWFRGIKECYKLFDWKYGIDNEFNKESPGFWKANVKVADIAKCAESYYQSALEKKDDSIVYMDLPIHFKRTFSSDGSNTLTGVSFIKKGVFYYYDLKQNELYVCGDDQHQRLADDFEIQIFLKELENLTDKEKTDFEGLIVGIKNVLNNQQDTNSKHSNL